VIEYKCNQCSLKGTGMIVNPARFFIVMIVVGMIGMTCDMYNESREALYEKRVQGTNRNK